MSQATHLYTSIRSAALAASAVGALLAGSATLNPARAADGAASIGELGIDNKAGDIAKGFAFGYILYQWLDNVIVGAVVRDIRAGGLNRKYAEVVPGAGYQARDLAAAAKLTHEFNVAMGYADDAQTALYLASASR